MHLHSHTQSRVMEDLLSRAEQFVSTSTGNDLILAAAAIAIAIVVGVLFRPARTPKSTRLLSLPPGPTPWPIVGSLPALGSASTPFRALADMADKYGPIMFLRLGSIPTVVVSSANVAMDIFKNQDAVFASRPMLVLAKYVGFGENNMIGLGPTGPYFTKMRKIYAQHVVSASRVAGAKPIREEEVRCMLRAVLSDLRRGSGPDGRAAVNVTMKLIVMNANNMTRMIFGHKFFGDDLSQRGGLAEEYKSCMRLTTELLAAFNLGDYVAWLRPFDLQRLERKMKSLQVRLKKLVQGFIEEHRDAKNARPEDIIDVLLSLDGEEKVTDEQLMAAALELLIGGSESSAATVEWALAELINNPSKLKAAQDELDAVVGRDRPVEESDLPNLHYLGCVLKETMRLRPAGPLGLPHATTTQTELGGYRVPKNSTVIFNLWKIGRDPAFWECPEEFRPERFDGSDVNVYGQNYQLLPFGSGRRKCPGLHLAVAMSGLALGALLQSFEWDCSTKVDMSERFGAVTVRSNPLLVNLRPRLPLRLFESF